MKDLLAEIEAGREIAKPRVLIGSDAGQNKLLVTLNVLDEENLQQTVNGKKATASQSSFLIAVADSTPENYHNMSIIFRKLGFPLDNELSQR